MGGFSDPAKNCRRWSSCLYRPPVRCETGGFVVVRTISRRQEMNELIRQLQRGNWKEYIPIVRLSNGSHIEGHWLKGIGIPQYAVLTRIDENDLERKVGRMEVVNELNEVVAVVER